MEKFGSSYRKSLQCTSANSSTQGTFIFELANVRINQQKSFNKRQKTFVRISEMCELSKFELSGTKYKTFLNQAHGTWEFVRNNEKFELTDVYCIL